MANQKLPHRKHDVIRSHLAGMTLNYCPNSPDKRHAFIQQEYEPEVKSCRWCRLLVIPEASRGSAV